MPDTDVSIIFLLFFPALCLISAVRRIQCAEFREIINLDQVTFLHRINAKFIFFKMTEHCHIIPVNLTVLFFFKFQFQMTFQLFPSSLLQRDTLKSCQPPLPPVRLQERTIPFSTCISHSSVSSSVQTAL